MQSSDQEHEEELPEPQADNEEKNPTVATCGCLLATTLGGAFVGMAVGPAVAFQHGAGDFAGMIGIGPGLIVGGSIGFVVSLLILIVTGRF